MERSSSTKTGICKTLLVDKYIHEKKSARLIANEIGCSENKVNFWLKRYKIQKRSISEAVYLKSNPTGDPFAFNQPQNIASSLLFGLGIGLYWGEGNKKNKTTVRLGNTDPFLIRSFITFLIKIYEVKREKFRFGLQIFNDMDPEEVLSFWVKELGFPRSHFGKVIVTPARAAGTYREKTKHGVLTVYVSNSKLRNILNSEIEKMKEMPYSAIVQ